MDRDDVARPARRPGTTRGHAALRRSLMYTVEMRRAAGRDYISTPPRHFLSLLAVRSTCVQSCLALEVRDWWPWGTRQLLKIILLCRVMLADFHRQSFGQRPQNVVSCIGDLIHRRILCSLFPM